MEIVVVSYPHEIRASEFNHLVEKSYIFVCAIHLSLGIYGSKSARMLVIEPRIIILVQRHVHKQRGFDYLSARSFLKRVHLLLVPNYLVGGQSAVTEFIPVFVKSLIVAVHINKSVYGFSLFVYYVYYVITYAVGISRLQKRILVSFEQIGKFLFAFVAVIRSYLTARRV